MCLKEIGPCFQNEITILGSVINIIGGTYDHFMSMRILNFSNKYDIRVSFKNIEESGYSLDLDLPTILY